MAAARRGNAAPKPVLRRLWLPLACMVILLVGGAGMLLWQQHEHELTEKFATQTYSINREFHIDLDNQARGLAIAARQIAADPRLSQELDSRDADHLLATWQQVFESMRQEHHVTHFYFLDANRVCLLRVHHPTRRGDVINRFTAKEAERTGKTAWGIELGPLGTFTLRVVQPVYDHGQLIGYVELGKEIEDVVQARRDRTGLELAVIINKKYLNRTAWENGMQMLGRQADWDRLPHRVLTYSSLGNLPDQVASWADPAVGNHNHNESERELTYAGKCWRVSAIPMQDAAGQEVGDLLVMRDITADNAEFASQMARGGTLGGALLILLLGFIYVLLRRADAGIDAQQAALRDSEEHLAATLRSIGDGVIVTDATGRITHCNTVAQTLCGWSADEASGRPIAEVFHIIHATTRQEAEIPIARVLREDRIVELANHTALIARDGTERHIADSCAPIHDVAGRVSGAVLVFRDVTQAYRQRELLQQSEEKHRALFEDSPDAYLILVDERIADCNKTTEMMLRGTRSQIIGQTPVAFSPEFQPDGRPSAEAAPILVQTAIKTGKHHFEWIHRRLDGSEFWVEVSLSPMTLNGKQALFVSWRDITERKQIVETLRTSQFLLAQAMDMAELANWEYDVATDHFTFDDRFYNLYGTTAEREGGSRMPSAVYASTFVHPDETAIVATEIVKALHTTENHYEKQLEHRIVRRDGEIRHIIVRFAIERDAQGHIVKFRGANQDITERKQAEESLRIERENLKAIFASSPVGMLLLDEETKIIDANSVLAGMVSRSLGQIIRQRGGGGLGCVHSLESPQGCGFAMACASCPLRQSITQVLDAGTSIHGAEIQASLIINGQEHHPWLSVSAEPVTLHGRRHVLVAIDDISRRKQAEEELRERTETLQAINTELESQQLMLFAQTRAIRALLDGMPGQSFLKDRDGTYLAANQMFCQTVGKTEEQIIGSTDLDILPPDVACKSLADDQQIFSRELPMVETEEQITRNQRQEWLLTRKIPVLAKDGSVTHLVGISMDITARKEMEEELRIAARTDKLTGLPNRALFNDRLQQAILRAKRHTDYHYAVLFLDFDRFKTINDSLGHEVGDQLLQEIGRRLQAIVRSGDSLSREARESTTARLGGDEFVVLLDKVASPEDAYSVAERLLEAFTQPYQLGPHKVYSTASIGIVTSAMPADSPEDVLRDADTAMYEAKLAGRSKYVVFDVSMRHRVQNRLNLENDLRKAVEARQLFLMYQPIVCLQTGRLESYEALVRWQHPERGLIGPGEFISIAEETGLILPIGEWVLREACRQFVQWQESLGERASHSISVNLSRKQLHAPNLLETIQQILDQTKIAPDRLHLEVTESAVMTDGAAAVRVLQAIKALGVKLDMDDFGTGYSSLACLHQFPIEVLKIDRSFIANIDRGRDFAVLVQAVAQLARNLNIKVIAEGIETAEQAMMLQSLDCEYGQGYFFSKPMHAQQVPAFRIQPGKLPGQALAPAMSMARGRTA